MSTERITLIDNGKVVATEQDTANVFNTFFSNVVTNIKISEYTDYDAVANSISDPILKVIVRYKNHPSISPKEKYAKSHINSLFHFH